MLVQLEELARRRGKSTADALGDVLADFLEADLLDYQDAVHSLDEFSRKPELPR